MHGILGCVRSVISVRNPIHVTRPYPTQIISLPAFHAPSRSGLREITLQEGTCREDTRQLSGNGEEEKYPPVFRSNLSSIGKVRASVSQVFMTCSLYM